MSLNAERKIKIVEEYATKKGDTGSPEVQIAILTTRINELSVHMQSHHKDISSRRGLLTMVARRRKLLDYVKRIDEARYQSLLTRLNIRR
ncbi:MAG TPA: 30S ribosomal protein S15 [Micavibrio sp.]